MKEVQNVVFSSVVGELEKFEELLKSEDRAIYRQILRKPLLNLFDNNSKNIFQSWMFLMLNMMMEHEKKLGTIEDLYQGISAGYIEKPSFKFTVDQL